MNLLANVLWPYYGALLAQLIPVFLLIETLILVRYFPKSRWLALAWVTGANLVSTFVGAILVSPLQLLGWDSMKLLAADQYKACIVAFFVTLLIEYPVLAISKNFRDRSRRFRAVLMMNLATYAICVAVITYHWRWGANSGPETEEAALSPAPFTMDTQRIPGLQSTLAIFCQKSVN